MSTLDISSSLQLVDDLLTKVKEVTKWKTLSEAGIEPKCMQAYATTVRSCRDDKYFGLTHHLNEQDPSVGAFTGGYFERRERPLRKGMESQKSLGAFYECEANYINADGYWMAFNQASIPLRKEAMEDKNFVNAELFDVWAIIAITYGIRFTGLLAEFYKFVRRDPVYAKLLLPTLEQRTDIPASDDLIESTEKLDTHMSMQLMKAVATISASNATNRAGKGNVASDN